MTINRRVKEVRKSMNLTQRQFAKKIAISNGYLACIELGNRKVNERLIKLIGSTFSVNEGWLRSGCGEMLNNDVDMNMKEALTILAQLKREYQCLAFKQILQLLQAQNTSKDPSAMDKC